MEIGTAKKDFEATSSALLEYLGIYQTEVTKARNVWPGVTMFISTRVALAICTYRE
jgi:hypothetical protein